jgi:hypothetical protein
MKIKTSDTWTFFSDFCTAKKDDGCSLDPDAIRNCQPCDCVRIYDGQKIQNLLNQYEEIKKNCGCFRKNDNDGCESCAYPSHNSGNDEETRGNCMFDLCPKIEKIIEEEDN